MILRGTHGGPSTPEVLSHTPPNLLAGEPSWDVPPGQEQQQMQEAPRSRCRGAMGQRGPDARPRVGHTGASKSQFDPKPNPPELLQMGQWPRAPQPGRTQPGRSNRTSRARSPKEPPQHALSKGQRPGRPQTLLPAPQLAAFLCLTAPRPTEGPHQVTSAASRLGKLRLEAPSN